MIEVTWRMPSEPGSPAPWQTTRFSHGHGLRIEHDGDVVYVNATYVDGPIKDVTLAAVNTDCFVSAVEMPDGDIMAVVDAVADGTHPAIRGALEPLRQNVNGLLVNLGGRRHPLAVVPPPLCDPEPGTEVHDASTGAATPEED